MIVVRKTGKPNDGILAWFFATIMPFRKQGEHSGYSFDLTGQEPSQSAYQFHLNARIAIELTSVHTSIS